MSSDQEFVRPKMPPSLFHKAAFLAAASMANVAPAQTAYFSVQNGGSGQQFVIALDDPQSIQIARRIISGSEKEEIHVLGKVIPRPEQYNKPGPSGIPWAFHLEPATIRFFHFGARGCDATTSYVDSHARAGNLDKYLIPPSMWCPWASKVVVELSENGYPIKPRLKSGH